MVAMSGGVDSSVAAYLLCRQGHHVVGVTMCLGIVDTSGRPSAVDLKRSGMQEKCEILDIPHYVMDFSSKLHADVITDFVNQYTEGRTPNPCVRCNRYLKFGSLLDYAQSCGFDYIATGHYAGIAIYKDKPVLKRRLGDPKDQTYFLYSIPSSRLNNILFPLSETDKPQVRNWPKRLDSLWHPNRKARRYVLSLATITGRFSEDMTLSRPNLEKLSIPGEKF